MISEYKWWVKKQMQLLKQIWAKYMQLIDQGNLIENVISNINSSKVYQKDNIPTNVLKENVDICTTVIFSDINKYILNGTFPSNLKYADITQIDFLKTIIDPVSILCTLSKMYEKILY